MQTYTFFFDIIHNMILRKLRLVLLLLCIVFMSGVSGYMLIEGWGFLDSLYMTVMILIGEAKEIRSIKEISG